MFPIIFTVIILWYNFGSKVFDREELMPVLSFMLAITFHSLMFFINFWNADISIIIQYNKLSDDEELGACSHIWVQMENKKMESIKKLIVPLVMESHEITPGNLKTVYSIEIMKKSMHWDNSRRTFRSIPYPVKDTIGFYQEAPGIEDREEEKNANLMWGNNTMKIPIPTFLDLYQEHVVAPFFVF